MIKLRTWYLAGPMRGYPQYNTPAFREAASRLRANGYNIISPAELDSPSIQAAAQASLDGKECDATGQIGGETPGQILGRDVQVIMDCVTGIALLPDWWKSRGARLEVFVGLTQGHVFASYFDGILLIVPRLEVFTALTRALEELVHATPN